MLSNVNPAYIHKYTLAWKLLPPAISQLLSLNNPTWQIAACSRYTGTQCGLFGKVASVGIRQTLPST